MTDRISGFLVVLDDSKREDDAEYILNAIRLLKGVASVVPVKTDYPVEEIAATKAKVEIRKILADLYKSI